MGFYEFLRIEEQGVLRILIVFDGVLIVPKAQIFTSLITEYIKTEGFEFEDNKMNFCFVIIIWL